MLRLQAQHLIAIRQKWVTKNTRRSTSDFALIDSSRPFLGNTQLAEFLNTCLPSCHNNLDPNFPNSASAFCRYKPWRQSFILQKSTRLSQSYSQGYPPFNATLHIFPPDTATVAWCTAIGEEHRCAWWAILVMWSIDQFGEFESRPRFSETIVQSVIVSTLPAFWVRNKHLTASSPTGELSRASIWPYLISQPWCLYNSDR